MVSWISRAIRARSSRMPASRAWVSSWAWSPAFSTSATSSLASAWRRSSFCSLIFSPTIEPAPMTTVWIAMITT